MKTKSSIVPNHNVLRASETIFRVSERMPGTIRIDRKERDFEELSNFIVALQRGAYLWPSCAKS